VDLFFTKFFCYFKYNALPFHIICRHFCSDDGNNFQTRYWMQIYRTDCCANWMLYFAFISGRNV